MIWNAEVNFAVCYAFQDDDAKSYSPLRSANEEDNSSNQNLTIGRDAPIRISRRLADQLKDGMTGADSEDVRISVEKTTNLSEFRTVSSMYPMAEQDSSSAQTLAGNVSSLEQGQSVEKISNSNSEYLSEQEVMIHYSF
jgi:hypothetical protein